MIRRIRRPRIESRGCQVEDCFRRIQSVALRGGYDDARAALLDAIADKLQAEAQDLKTGLEKVIGIREGRSLVAND